MKTHWKKLVNPDYLGAYSLDDDTGNYKDIVVTIAYVRLEQVTGTDGKKDSCMVAHFQENVKPMILNITNAKTLTKLLKSPHIEDWAGHRIQIGVEQVKAFGDIVDALRIRKHLPRDEGAPKCEDCGADVGPAFGLTLNQMLAQGRKRFGAILCGSCMEKRAAEKAAAEAEPSDSGMEPKPESEAMNEEVSADEHDS